MNAAVASGAPVVVPDRGSRGKRNHVVASVLVVVVLLVAMVGAAPLTS